MMPGPLPEPERAKPVLVILALLAVLACAVLVYQAVERAGSSDADELVTTAVTSAVTVATEPPTANPPPTVDDYELPRDVVEGALVTLVQAEYPDQFAGVPDEQIVRLAETACDALDAGVTVDRMLGIIAEQNPTSDATAEAYAFHLGASIEGFCPEYSDQVG